MEYYQTDDVKVVFLLQSDLINGLSDEDIITRREKYGANILPDVKSRSVMTIFISQFENPLIYILVGAALIIFIFGNDKLDAFIISGVLLFNAILGTVQEMRTKNIVDSLKHFIKTESIVLRNGKKIIVEDKELVLGDIIFLKEGERVPADARIVEENNIHVDESSLTGESQAVKKNSATIAHNVPLGDRTNMLYKGTYVLAGAAKAIVVAVGTASEIGKIHVVAETIQMDMPLRKELDTLSYWILIFIIGVCSVLFIIGLYTGKPLNELLVMLTALFICVVPEGLPVVFMLVLVTGALRMAKQFVLVKNMQAVEALGRTDVIIIDKTGTLTRNEMIVSSVWACEKLWHISGQGYRTQGKIYRNGFLVKDTSVCEKDLAQMAIASALLSNAEIIYIPHLDLFEIKGDPTEAALSIFARKVNKDIDEIISSYKKLYEIPFTSTLRYHAAFYSKDDEIVAYIIGSPEVLIYRSDMSNEADRMLEQLLDEGFRGIAIGMKRLQKVQFNAEQTEEMYQKIFEKDIEFLGFCFLEDSIRSEVNSVVQDARKAGLSVVMATGDHQKTALHVARMVGIYRTSDECMDGVQLDALSDAQLLKKIDKVTVFSRVSAAHKMRIVTILQQQKKIVAMTGDGINDVPSLVKADLGIAMGSIGTQVAKQASDLVLLHDSFATIIEAIEEGRHIFYTLKRVLLYFFSTNMAEVFIVLFSFVVSLANGYDLPLPITAVQILWLNLVTDGFLDVGLSMEPKESGLLKRVWLDKKERLCDGILFAKMLFMALPMGIGSLAVFLSYYQEDVVHARTMTLLTMAMFQWFNAWNCRSATKSVLDSNFFANKWLIAATLFVLLLQCCLLYVPTMNYIFKTVPLSGDDWYVVISVSSTILLIEEIRKFFMRKLSELD